MSKIFKFLAFDFGASSGRAILAKFDGEKLELEEKHRFSNDPVTINGDFHWDVLRLFFEIKQGILKCANSGDRDIDCIGIDTWAVDYGLLDKNDKLLNLNVVTAIAWKLGATTVTLDADTINAIVCKLEFFRDTSGAEFEVEKLIEGDALDAVMREDENGKQYRFPVIPFCDSTNDYAVSEERAK